MQLTTEGLIRALYPAFDSGAIYPLTHDLADFKSLMQPLEITGAPVIDIQGYKRALKVPVAGLSLTFPTADLTAANLLNNTDSSFTVGLQFYLTSATFTGSKILYRVGSGADYVIFKIDGTTSKLVWEVSAAGVVTTAEAAGVVKVGWNSMYVNKTTALSSFTLNGVASTTTIGSISTTGVTSTAALEVAPGTGPEMWIAGLIYAPKPPYTTDSAILYNACAVPQLRLRYGVSDVKIDPKWNIDLKKHGTEDQMITTIPPDIAAGLRYTTTIFVNGYDGEPVFLDVHEMPVSAGEYAWDSTKEFPGRLLEEFLAMQKSWGGANGGVVSDNIETGPDGTIRIYANGDSYTGNVQGVDGFGVPLTHTDSSDPLLGEPWTNRVGGFLTSKTYRGFGSYKVFARVPQQTGVAVTFQIRHKESLYDFDPRAAEAIAEGNLAAGGVVTRQHQSSVNLPVKTTAPDAAFTNLKGITQIGISPTEIQEEGITTTIDVLDDKIHEYRIDWHSDRVEFYLDGTLLKTNSAVKPNIAGVFEFGLWFPSEPLSAKPWLADPATAWAGGTVNPDGGMVADWDREYMDIYKVTFSPFSDEVARIIGETHPFEYTIELSKGYYGDLAYEFDTSDGEIGTIVFSMDDQRFRGVDTYQSEGLTNTGGVYGSMFQGGMWEHEVDDENFNSYYGEQHLSELSIASIGGDHKIKTWLTLSVEGSDAPVRTRFKDSELHESRIGKLNYDPREQVYYAPLLRAEPNIINGERMRGSYLIALMQYKVGNKLQLKAFNVGFKISAGHEYI